MPDGKAFELSCPVPIHRYERVVMAHGGGGRLMQQLIDQVFRPAFGTVKPEYQHDAAVLEAAPVRLAFTTDSYVIQPIFFPGGDIGRLAVFGTVNDLAMAGACPRWLSCSLILEEGFPMADLWRIVESMAAAAREAEVELVTGDTKVVDRGKGDGVFVNTAGVGVIEHELAIGAQSLRPGDACIVSGDLGRHGVAVMNARENLGLQTTLTSDLAPLREPVLRLLAAPLEIHCLRDLTRGGLGAALVELATAAGLDIRIRESDVPVSEPVRAACEILGLDPLFMANEGRFVLFLPAAQAPTALEILRSLEVTAEARIIGSVEESEGGTVIVESFLGGERLLDLPSGEQLPRIC
ncbi:MAG: hydrogenase expression/formation protein HypE [Acidobacteriota bacterium]